MKSRIKKGIFVLIVASSMLSCRREESKEPLTPVRFTNVHFTDQFWAPKIEVNRTVSIPSAFKKSEETGRMDNLALAGGLIKGEHQGDFPFDDTDVYKILEGASYSLAVKYDAKLDHYLDSLIYLIGSAQEDDGYLYTCITNKCERLRSWYGKGRWDRLNSHELYNCGHLYEAAVAHYQSTGKRTLLDIALKNADLVNTIFGPEEGKKKAPSGHPIVEMALVKLYHVTKDEKYLKLARFFIDETGKGTDGHKLNEYSQDHMPIIDQEEAVGHAVRLGYLYSGVTDVASLMNDKPLMDASKLVWNNVVSKKIYITGGIGSRAQGEGFGPNYELSNMADYCETCASISNVFWNYRLFLNEKEAKYFDVLERVLYNGVISGVSLSGDKFFYDNPLESVHNHDRAPWFGCACCPGNVTRFMPSVPGYVYAVSDRNIYVNLFAKGDATIPFGNDTVEISQETLYPWEGMIRLTINKTPVLNFGLKVRIPGWARGKVVPSDLYHFIDGNDNTYTIKINGKEKTFDLVGGYAELKHKWKKGDEVEIIFPMDARKIAANENVENDHGKLAYQRGPIVYCFEDKDNNGDWLFDDFINANASIKPKFEPDLLGGVVTLRVEGEKVKNIKGEKQVEPVQLKAIPYYAWNNRGKANMLVWMPDEEETAILHHQPSPIDSVKVTASVNWTPGLNDGFDPKSSHDYDKAYFYWWQKKGTNEWVQYNFKEPVILYESSVYWLRMDHYDVDYRVPENWELEFMNSNGKWSPVSTNDSYSTNLDQYNMISFKPIKTTALRLNVKLQENVSGGILEWKVN